MSSGANARLDAVDNSRRQRTPGDFPRTGDNEPWFWDGVSRKKDGQPRLQRAGRSSNAGGSVKGAGMALTRYKETGDFHAVAVMMDEAMRLIGPYPELWDTTNQSIRSTMNTLLVEGRKRAGVWLKADRGTLIHTVCERVALAIGNGRVPLVDDLYDAAQDLGMTAELIDQARDLFIELFTDVLRPIHAEVRAVNLDYNLAGTADLVVETLVDLEFEGGLVIPAGDVIGGDLKTGRVDSLTRVSQASQLHGYFGPGAMRYVFDSDDDQLGHPEPWPDEMRRDVAVVVQLTLDDAIKTGSLVLRLVGVDLDEGKVALDLAKLVNGFDLPAALRHHKGESLQRSLQDSEMGTALAISIDAVAHQRTVEWLLGRLQVLIDSPARADVIKEWPDEIERDALKTKSLKPELVNFVSRWFGSLEARYSIPFGPTDPRRDVPATRSR